MKFQIVQLSSYPYENPNPGELQFAQPKSTYMPNKGIETLIFIGGGILIVIFLLFLLNFLNQKKITRPHYPESKSLSN